MRLPMKERCLPVDDEHTTDTFDLALGDDC